MNVQKRNDVSIYCLSSGPTLPEWLGERARRNLSKNDESLRRRIELIQDFQMPSSSSKIVQSADGRYIVAAGTYPPRIRCYDVHDLTMKFERYVNAHVIDIAMLGEDYGKMALLQEDRTIALHAPYGAHESVRIPTFGRGMVYEPTTCELLLAAKGESVYRLNLEEGRFSEPWELNEVGVSSTCIVVAPSYALATVGCDDGTVRFWDNRSPDTLKPFLKLDVKSAITGYGYADQLYGNPEEIHSLAQDPTGLYLAAGTAGGIVALYDVRSSRPLHIVEHKHGTAIHTIKFHPGSGTILSSDEALVKIWRYKSSGDVLHTSRGDASADSMEVSTNGNAAIGSVVANVEGTGKFSHFITTADDSDRHGYNSGLILCTTDQPKMEAFFVPALGMAPKWCSFLENITEELEERELKREGTTAASDLVRDGQENIYENYKFVSHEDLEKLGITNLIGTPILRGYMHGFFMDINLYNRVRAVANPFEYEEYRKKKLKDRLEAKRASRIAPKESKTPKTAVNPELAERLMDKAKDSTKAGKIANKMLSDDRFKSLFTDPDFHIDEEGEEFKLRNPSGVAAIKRKKNNLDSDEEDEDDVSEESAEPSGFRRIDGGDEDSSDLEAADDSESSSDDDGFEGAKVRGEQYEEMKKLQSNQPRKAKRKKVAHKKTSKTVLYEGESASGAAVDFGLGDESASKRSKERKIEMNLPLGQRAAVQQPPPGQLRIRGEASSKEVSYIPRDARKKMEEREAQREAQMGSKRKRRGIKELGFKEPFKHNK